MLKDKIVVERQLDAPAQIIWKALTDPVEMKKWYFDLPDFRPEPGARFQFSGGPEGHVYIHLCEVTRAEENKVIAYTWKYEGYEGESLVSFELFPNDAGTLLRLTHEGLESFPANNPHFASTEFEKGWDMIVNQLLPGYLEKIS